MKFNNQSTFNGHQITNVVDRPILHKKGKRWITIGLSTLLLAGLGTVATTGGVHASNIQTNNNVDKVNSNTTGDKPTPSNITTKANELHDQILSNEAMYHHSNVGLSKLAMTPKSVGTQSASNSSNSVSSQSSSSNVKASSNSSTSSNSSSSVSDNGMTTLNLGTKAQQAKGWNFVQAGINNNDLDNAKTGDSSSASGDQTTPVSSASSKSSVVSGSNSASKVPSNAPINARKPFNSAYQSMMSQMSGTDSKVASMNAVNAQSNSDKKNIKKPLIKDSNDASQYFSGGIIKTGSDDGLNYEVYKNGGVEFTDGTANSDLSYFSSNNSDVRSAKAIKFDNAIDTSKVTNMSQMLENDSSLTNINLSSLDTSHVTNMNNMMDQDSSLISIDLSNLDTSHVTNMSDMLGMNPKLQSVKMPNSSTGVSANLSLMFGLDSSLTHVDFSNFDTYSASNTSDMFYNDSNLQSIIIRSPHTILVNDNSTMPSLYKKDSNDNYTSPIPNSFTQGTVGTFVALENVPYVTINYMNGNQNVGSQNISGDAKHYNGNGYNNLTDADFTTPNNYHLVGSNDSIPFDGKSHNVQIALDYDFGSAVTQANTYNNGIPSVNNASATSIYNKASGYAQNTAPDTNPTDLTNQFTNTSKAYSTFTNDSNQAKNAKTQASNYAQAVANDSNAQNENDAKADLAQASAYAQQATTYANRANNDISGMTDNTTPNVYDFTSASNQANGIKLASANYTQANQISNVASGYANSANVDTNSSAITNQHNTDNNVLNQLNTINGQINSANNDTNTYIGQLRNAIQASNYNNASADLSNAVSANNVANSLSNNNFATEAGSMTDSVSASIFNFASVDNETASIHPAVINSTTATSMSNKAKDAENSASTDTNSSAVNSQETRDTGDYNQVVTLAGKVTSANNLANSYINDVHNDSKTSNVSAINTDLSNAQSANRNAQQLNNQLDNAENNMSDDVTPDEYNFSSANTTAHNIKLASVNSSNASKISAIASGYASSAYVDSNSSAITSQHNIDTNLSNQMSTLAGQISTANGQATAYINKVHQDSKAKNVNATIADLSSALSINGTANTDNNKLNALASSMKDSTTPKGKTVNYTGNVILDYQTNGKDISDVNGQPVKNNIQVPYNIPVAMNSDGSLFASKTASDYLKEKTPAQLKSSDFTVGNVTLNGLSNDGKFSPRTADDIITSVSQKTGNVSNDYVLYLNAKPAQPINVTFSDQAGNKQYQQVSGNGHYDYEKVSDISKLAGVPSGYTANKTGAQFMDTPKNVTVKTTGNKITNEPVKVTINKYIAGKSAGSYTTTVPETGLVGNKFTVNPNDVAPNNYKSSDNSITASFTPTGLSQNTASFNYNELLTIYNLAFYDQNNSDNLVSYQTNFKGYQGEKYNIVTASDAKNNHNPQSDIVIPSGYEPNNTNETVTLGSNTNLSINIKNNPNANQSNSADIPVIGHQITFNGNIKLHFQSSDNNDIKDLTIPYSITTSVDDTIQDLLEHGSDKNGDLPVAVPTDYINHVIQGFNTTNYSYAHNVNGNTYNNLWISPNMAGAQDTNASDQVSGHYDNSDNTYVNPDFTLNFNALYPDDDTTNTNSPSNPNSNTNPTNSNSKDNGKSKQHTNIPNPWIPKNSDSPFNPSNPNSPFNPVSPFNPENPNSPFNPKNCNNDTSPNDPNSPYNPTNPNSILNPKNSNSPLNPSKSNSPLNTNNNPYQPNDTNDNPWNPLTPDSPLHPTNPNSPLDIKNSSNPDNKNNSGNNNNPVNPNNEKNHNHTPSDTPTTPTNSSDIPSTPQKDSKKHATPNGPSGDKGKGYNPYVPTHKDDHGNNIPDKTSDTPDKTNTTPNQSDTNKGSNTPASPNEENTTFYVKINDFNHGYLVQSYKKRINESKVGQSFTLNPSDYTTTGYQMSNGKSVSDASYTGYVSADGLMNKNNQPQNSIIWNYYAKSHTVHAHYINQHGKQLNPSDTNNNTVTGNTGDDLTPSDVDKQAKLPAGYHLVQNNNYQFKPINNSDITYQVAGNDLSTINAHITVHINHDGQSYKHYTEPISLQGKSVGDSDIVINPAQYQPTNDAYHTVPLNEAPITIHVSDGNDFVNGNYIDNDKPTTTFTYNAKTAPSLVIRYVDIDPNAQSVNKGNDSQGRPIIESDSYSAKTLESAPYNLDWVIGNKYTFGLVGSTNKNTVNLIKAPAGYDIVNDASGFNYQRGIETMTLTNGTNYKGHHAMLLMVGLGTTPTHHIHPSSASSTSSSASIPSSSSNAPASSATNSSSSSVVVPNSSSVPSSESTSSESISMNSSEVSTLASEIGANIVIRPSITDKTIDNTQNDTVLDDMASEISINNQEISSLANKQATVSTPTSTSAPTNDIVRTNNNSNDIKPTPTYHINDSHKKAVHYYVYSPTNIILHGKNSSIKISKRRGFTGKIIKVAKVNGKRAYVIRWHHKNYVVNAKKVRNAYIQVKDFNHMAHGLIKHATVKLRKNAMIYSNIHFNKADRITNAKAGSTFTVIGIKKFGEKGYHQTRLVLSNGLIITANRNYVKLI